jgi:hypothetical protein
VIKARTELSACTVFHAVALAFVVQALFGKANKHVPCCLVLVGLDLLSSTWTAPAYPESLQSFFSCGVLKSTEGLTAHRSSGAYLPLATLCYASDSHACSMKCKRAVRFTIMFPLALHLEAMTYLCTACGFQICSMMSFSAYVAGAAHCNLRANCTLLEMHFLSSCIHKVGFAWLSCVPIS